MKNMIRTFIFCSTMAAGISPALTQAISNSSNQLEFIEEEKGTFAYIQDDKLIFSTKIANKDVTPFVVVDSGKSDIKECLYPNLIAKRPNGEEITFAFSFPRNCYNSKIEKIMVFLPPDRTNHNSKDFLSFIPKS